MLPRSKVILKKPPKGLLRFGHPWVYRSQIHEAPPPDMAGCLVEIISGGGRPLGVGYWNPRSEISIRFLSHLHEPIDKEFFKKKILKAVSLREKWSRGSNVFRVVSSEADFLPGLIVDKYGDVLVVQFLTLGMENLKPVILQALEESVPSKGLYEQSVSGSRRLEGLEERSGWIRQECAGHTEIAEESIRYRIPFGEGHKTGFYLDQRENRCALARLGIQGEVLDAFCYTGGFGLHLARAGCRVLGIDSQDEAIRQAEENRRLNEISEENLRFKVANVFDELRALEKERRNFDFIILDPPSFMKTKKALEGALAGYKEILLRSMKILKESGGLAVFSCSYHVDDTLLLQTAMGAARDARKNLRILQFLKQSSDHPINPFIPETYYLKGFLFEITST